MFRDALPTNINYGGTMVMKVDDAMTAQGGTFATPADPLTKKAYNAPADDGIPYGCPTHPQVAENERKRAEDDARKALAAAKAASPSYVEPTADDKQSFAERMKKAKASKAK